MHELIRGWPGIAGDDVRDTRQLVAQVCRSSRCTFGCPACPSLEGEEGFLDLLRAHEIGISLSDEFQLVPGQSTPAIAYHHRVAKSSTI